MRCLLLFLFFYITVSFLVILFHKNISNANVNDFNFVKLIITLYLEC